MSFVGELNDKMKGFYRSKYSIAGEERYGAVTQFEVYHILECTVYLWLCLDCCVFLIILDISHFNSSASLMHLLFLFVSLV